MARRRPRWQAVALIAVVASLAFATQLAHLTIIKHAVCAQHGQIVHLAPGEQAETPRRAATDAEGALFSGDRPEHDHGHCNALAHAHALITTPPPAPLTVLTWERIAARPHAGVVWTRGDILRLAPKTSPPA